MIELMVLGSHLKRLDNIVQWQEQDVFQRESVSQHSFKVAVFTRVILEDLFGASLNGNIEELKLMCVTHALFHDFDEAIFLRDASHNVKYNKYNGEEIRNAINHYVQHQFESDFQEYKNAQSNEYTDSYLMLKKNIVEVAPIAKAVVKVADWLALLYFCNRELAQNNGGFEETCKYCKNGVLKAAVNMVGVLAAFYPDIDIDSFMKKINLIVYGTGK